MSWNLDSRTGVKHEHSLFQCEIHAWHFDIQNNTDETWLFITLSNTVKSCPYNRPWRPIGLWDVKDPMLCRQSTHRWWQGCQPFAPAVLNSPETLFFCFWYSYGRRDPSRWPRGTLYPHKLAITLPTSGSRSVGIVRSWTQTMEFLIIILIMNHTVLSSRVVGRTEYL
jgi:hypothetical protein